jgi:Tol biopolymer transport system component
MRCVFLMACVATTIGAQEPAIFAPGIISGGSNELSPAFAPDCRAVWYTVSNGTENVIVTSHVANGKWTSPTVAEFSGYWRDLEASMAPDGSYLVFASNRPATDGGAALDGNYGGAVQPGRGGNLWRVDRHGGGWGKPVRLPETVNASTSVFSPSVVADGSLYFMKASPETGRFQIYRSQRTNGQYETPERVSFSDEQWSNVDPAVAPDESFAVFSSNRPPTADKDIDLFITYRHNGVWDAPTSLGPRVNSPSREIEARLSPDGRALFFASNRIVPTPAGSPVALDRMRSWNNGLMHIWRVDLAPSRPSMCPLG